MVIACQYKEPKGMPLVARESLPDLNHKASYCPWRGQLSIRGQLLCSIALRTPFSSTIPAQLPPNLDMNHVMGLSDLKKKLPEAAFGKSNYVRNEVCFQGIYFSLYEVEISNKEQHKMDELLQNLKEKDLAIIKYLQDRGALILLTSTALTRDDAFDPEEPVSLLALFLFASSREVGLQADKQDPKAEKEEGDISLKIASVLPGLQYAVQKATKSSHREPVSTGARIKQHFQEFAKLEQNAQPTSGQPNPAPLSSLLSPAEEEGTNPLTKCSEQSFSQLRHYLSDPSSYSLEISAALGCLAGAAQSLCCSSEAVCNVDFSLVAPLDPVPPNVTALQVGNEAPKAAAGLTQGGKGTTADVTSAGKLRVQQSKRKSSRAIVSSSRKKWSPLKMQIHPVGDGSRNRKATKKKKINFAFPKKPGLAASPSEPMLKLANLQFPHRRKRGAEVLSAEFVHKTQAEPLQEATSSPTGEAKRAKKLKKPNGRKAPSAQAATKPLKKKMVKSPSKPQAKNQEEREPKESISILPSETLGKDLGASSVVSGIYPAEDVDLQGNNYESHALNLLADLALGSCIPELVPAACGAATEPRGHRRPRPSRSAFDHEYHRVDRLATAGTSPNHKLEKPAGKTDLKKDSGPISREKSPGVSSKKSNPSPSAAKLHEAQEPEVTRPSFICSEHSYASQMPEHARKPPHPRGTPHPTAWAARNGPRSGRPGPPVGQGLPFHPRQSGGPTDNFARTHTVRRCGGSVTVTCRCEAGYLFSLDSRYTRDALEKTVIRALHGPWDSDLPDDVEETKLILHMWVALFYSKPSKLLSSTRKVVEHSNPKKFVSINSTGDFLELSDDSEDGFGLETCPADSQSDPDRLPSLPKPGARSQGPFCTEQSPADSQTDSDGAQGLVDSTVSSSVGELPCVEEPSSTSHPESPSLSTRARESSPAAEEAPATPEEPPGEGPLDPAVAPGPSEELGDPSESPSTLARGEKPQVGALGGMGTLDAGECRDGDPCAAPPAAQHGHGADPCGPEPPMDSRARTPERASPAGRCPNPGSVSQEQPGARRRAGSCEAAGGRSGAAAACPAPLVLLGEPSALAVPERAHGATPIPSFLETLLRTRRETSPELCDTTDVSDALLGAKWFPGTEGHAASTHGSSCSDSDREDFGGTICQLRTSRASYSMKSMDAADAGSSWDVSSGSSEQADGRSEGWRSPGAPQRWWQPEPPYVSITDDRGVPRDYVNFTVTRRHRDAAGTRQPEMGCGRHGRHSHLLRSLLGTRRTSPGVTQDTLDLECLRFHYKLKQILRSRKPPSSTSESIFPKDSAVPGSPERRPGQRSPLRVTLLPSATGPAGVTRCPRSHAAPGHLRKLRYDGEPRAARGDIALILAEYAELGRVLRGRAGAGPARGAAAAPGASCPRRRPPAFEDTIAALCSALRCRLRRVARDASARAGLFYLVETGEDPFFARTKALLEEGGHKETEPLSFCKAPRLEAERLLVVIRNEDISSHIHKVPCLLRLKHCPNVVFAGLDQPEDLPGRTYQELFHTGGFVVSDDEVLETVTLGQLKEVMKVLEKLNSSGRWKWLLHYKESKKLREALRLDATARKKNLLLRSCQGADLVEVLHYHACDAAASRRAEALRCLLSLQVQHISARFAVYLTEKPGVSKEAFESQGILVADVNTFLGTVQKAAAPFQRSYW
ncbi:protein FAM208B [Nothoprocta perdicaria]|nr:protein FAM208B [Nothoprocta perdicaria]